MKQIAFLLELERKIFPAPFIEKREMRAYKISKPISTLVNNSQLNLILIVA